jgi:hypothetical protein|tara:strand:- start:245 stop:652 length:408 start_codon:yes stop_codon:yes gene_type:complete
MTQYTIANRAEASLICNEADALMDNMAEDGLKGSNNYEDMETVRDMLGILADKEATVKGARAVAFPYNLELSSAEGWQFEIAKEQGFDYIVEDEYKIAVALDLSMEEAREVARKVLEVGADSEANHLLGFLITRV